MWQQLLEKLQAGDVKSLARTISLVENRVAGYNRFMASLPLTATPVIGVTGAPGAGKSTLVDAMIESLVSDNKKVGVLCIDPSSPFNLGSLLGDRIRMSEWYNHPNVFIRSLATRGSLGGLHPMIIEITDVIRAAHFDYIIIETVGVGQSEIEIAGLADVTVVVLVPEGGDEIQTMKAGLMEIADVFVVNKSDRPDADLFVKNLRLMLAPAFSKSERQIPIVKTVASQRKGLSELWKQILEQQQQLKNTDKHLWLLAEKAYQLIQFKRMKDVNKSVLKDDINEQMKKNESFNLYEFIENL